MNDIVERLRDQFCDLSEDDYIEAAAEIESLRASISEFEKEAARYRWLRNRPKDDCTAPRIEVNKWTCNANDEGVFDSVNEGEVLSGDELDAAIDAEIHSDLTK